jgi:hypothetical protein
MGCLSLSISAHGALTVRHYNGWSTSSGQIDFSAATNVFVGEDTGVIDHWDGDRFHVWRPVTGVTQNYGVEWTGYVRFDEAGQYGFGTMSDDGSDVWIDGTRIVANHELQWYDWEDNISEGNTSGETFPPLVLAEGYHAITIRWYEQFSFAGIELWWLKPGSGPSDIPWYGTNFHGVAPTFNPNTNWELVPASVFVTNIPTLDGDYNDDGFVDAADYVVWRKLEGTSTVMSNDPNPAPIDNDQYVTWRGNYSDSSGSGSGGETANGSVPEPAIQFGALALIFASLLIRRRVV